jgi:hypothetical protein
LRPGTVWEKAPCGFDAEERDSRHAVHGLTSKFAPGIAC